MNRVVWFLLMVGFVFSGMEKSFANQELMVVYTSDTSGFVLECG